MSRPLLRWLAVVVAFLAALALAAWTTHDNEEWPDPLDPRNPGPDGAQALAEVLQDEGVAVHIVRSADDLDAEHVDAGTTVVVTGTSALSPATAERLRRHAAPGRLVVVDPSYRLAREYDGDLTARSVGDGTVPARCRGTSLLDGLELDVDRATAYAGFTDADTTCFATGGEADGGALLVESDGVVLFGAGQALRNEQVTRGDNAAVALRLLGQGERLLWYVPDPADASADDAVTLTSLLPDWIRPGLFLAALTTIALLLWRVRRLGPLSREPLPVVVRGVETALSRGRMYRRSGDRGHAARALRRAARRDLAARLRLDRRAPAHEVAAAAALETGAPVEEIAPLLTDDQAPPADDHDLVRLAQDLAHLRREVRRG